MVGYSKEELRGKQFKEIIPPSDMNSLYPWAEAQLKANGGVPFFERRLIRKDGVHVWTQCGIFKAANGYVLSRDIDITAQKGIEAELIQITGAFKKPLPPNIMGRQREVAKLASRDMSSQEIADALNLSKLTIDNYRVGLRRDLGIEKGERLSTFLERFRF